MDIIEPFFCALKAVATCRGFLHILFSRSAASLHEKSFSTFSRKP